MHLPKYLGGYEVDLETDNISSHEMLIGWVDEYGTITSSHVNVRIGDLVQTADHEFHALVIDINEFKKSLGVT